MIDALIAGKLFGAPVVKTAKNGSQFVTAKLRAACGEDSIFVSVIAFSQTVVKTLAAMTDGDSIALSGELKPKVWTDKNGSPRPSLDMTAHAVLTAYHIKRKRDAVTPEPKPSQPKAPPSDSATPPSDDAPPFDDDIPF